MIGKETKGKEDDSLRNSIKEKENRSCFREVDQDG